ncbi:MAG TPA: DUF1488 family protein [Paraburkholderia sp.]|uniref:DUF1488 family protein n=1 Tax=Paraburkholderia sp. TaxID=1926495 RepID=UPI002B499847|nr:DUF1488 family protein [Paraburkholderia sp.]HKR43784.1 DUF1488 family protein [Paraburkholderia sp.]
MQTAELEPQILANRFGVEFCLVRQNSTITCAITIAALGAHFWLETRAGDARILKTFRDGYDRIRAITERKWLAVPSTRLELTPADFARH